MRAEAQCGQTVVLSANLRSISPSGRQFFGETRGARYDGFIVIDECRAGPDFAAWPQGAIAHEKTRKQHQSRVVGFQNFAREGAHPPHDRTKRFDSLLDLETRGAVDRHVGSAMIRGSTTSACRVDDGKNRRDRVAETTREQSPGVGLGQDRDIGSLVGPGLG